MNGSVTVDELADHMVSRGIAVTRTTIRYHCRDPRGALHGVARRSGRQWVIPVDAARAFAESYSPYGTLRKGETGATPGAGPGAQHPTTPSEDVSEQYPESDRST